MVTGPISKVSMNLSGYAYPGHTELLAEKTNAPEHAMMLAGGNSGWSWPPSTARWPQCPRRLSTDGLLRLLRLTCKALAQDFGLAGAPLAVAALNPHAGKGACSAGRKKRS